MSIVTKLVIGDVILFSVLAVIASQLYRFHYDRSAVALTMIIVVGIVLEIYTYFTKVKKGIL